MNHLLKQLTRSFQPISLDDLNTRASLLERQENKYILSVEQLQEMLGFLSNKFDILTIGDQTAHNYRSVYFDTKEMVGYRYDIQGSIKRRFKARTRYYVESGLCYFEVKLKDKRGGTVKKRLRYDAKDYGTITPLAKRFLEDAYIALYGVPFEHQLTARLEGSYSRITLVAKAGGERMTIDFNLSFTNGTNTTLTRPLIIVETKSSNGNGIADMAFRRRNIRPQGCSKFCLGVNLLGFKVRYNKFKPLLEMYHRLPDNDYSQTLVDVQSQMVLSFPSPAQNQPSSQYSYQLQAEEYSKFAYAGLFKQLQIRRTILETSEDIYLVRTPAAVMV
ncbi:polyphosphate polymerase domain-containing protein [Candidatus Saccharibacteria bacterium]|nr:polyphosphate polymerase domain-containing protein [Candidatus Saccharibacteria bacterium]